MRVADPMNDMAKGLSDDDLRKFAEIIAKLPAPHPADGPVDAARIERARSLVAQNHCNFCHTATFAGQDNVPNIADQREDYLFKARCAVIKTIPATATTRPWPRSCSRSATIKSWIWPIISRALARSDAQVRDG
jgi:cytochrome c553